MTNLHSEALDLALDLKRDRPCAGTAGGISHLDVLAGPCVPLAVRDDTNGNIAAWSRSRCGASSRWGVEPPIAG